MPLEWPPFVCSLNLFLGCRPRRKRCALPEIINPKLQSDRPIGDGKTALLIFTILIVILLFSLLDVFNVRPVAPTHARQTQSEVTQTANVSRSAAGSPPIRQATNKLTLTPKRSQSPAPPARSVQFGWLSFIATPLYMALRFLYKHGIGNWGWSIIALTSIFNLLMFWPRVMSMKASLKVMRLQPKVDALKRRYAHLKFSDPQRTQMNNELMALYKAEGASMYGGMLPMLLQTPLLFAYFRVLRNATELHHANWFWLKDLSSPDPLHILPILILVTMLVTQYITPSPGMDVGQRRMLAVVMPVMMGFTLWHCASGVGLYWVTGNLMNLIIQFGMNRTSMGKEMHAIAASRAKAKMLELETLAAHPPSEVFLVDGEDRGHSKTGG